MSPSSPSRRGHRGDRSRNRRTTMLPLVGGCRCGPMLDPSEAFAPYMETFTREKLAWVSTPAVRGFDGFPELAGYPGLMQGYRERTGLLAALSDPASQ